MPQPADIVTRQDKRGNARTWWECPNCHRPLGEIIGARLVIIVNRNWNLTQVIHDSMTQTCPRCHAVSVCNGNL
jgi:biotin synthase-related radical SAM superfamily protein